MHKIFLAASLMLTAFTTNQIAVAQEINGTFFCVSSYEVRCSRNGCATGREDGIKFLYKTRQNTYTRCSNEAGQDKCLEFTGTLTTGESLAQYINVFSADSGSVFRIEGRPRSSDGFWFAYSIAGYLGMGWQALGKCSFVEGEK